jgi:hypothetical protein
MDASSETIARDRVADRQREEAEGGGEQDDVKHEDAPSDERARSERDVESRGERADPLFTRIGRTGRIGIREGRGNKVIGNS